MRTPQILRLVAGAAMTLLGGCVMRRMEHTGTRSARIPVAGAAILKLDVGAGFLRVQGSATASEIVVSGIAHAASPQILDAIQLVTRRVADTIFVSCTIPASRQEAGPSPALDVTVRVPSTLALVVRDSVGESIFRNVGPLRLVHGDGGLDIDNVAGPLDITHGDGDMIVANVRGNVHIVDGAGSIYVTNVQGSVTIPQDGSGEIQLVGVSGDVTVAAKRSGEVAARGVGGNLVVTAKGSGSIEYRDVKGHVTIPVGRYH